MTASTRMKSKRRKPPVRALAVLKKALRRLYPASPKFKILSAYPLYAPSLAALIQNRRLSSERLHGWVFVVRRGKRSRLIAEVHRLGTVYRFAFVSHGKDGSILLRHLRKPPALKGARKGELRILRVPQAHFQALWNHAKGAEMVRILSLPGQKGRRGWKDWSDLVMQLRTVAEARSKFDDKPLRNRRKRRKAKKSS